MEPTTHNGKHADSNVQQFVCFLLDCSASMKSQFSNGSLKGYDEADRMSACVEFLNSFGQRVDSAKIETRYGLISFSSSCEEISFDTDDWAGFTSSIQRIYPQGATNVFQAIDLAVNRMEKIKSKYVNAVLRIVCITDGFSTEEPIKELAKRILESNIIFDSIFLAKGVEPKLVALAKISGGSSLLIEDLKQGIQLFEHEAFINPLVRVIKPYSGDNVLKEFNSYSKVDITKDLADRYPPILEVLSEKHLKVPSDDKKSTEAKTRQRSIIKQVRFAWANNDPNIRIFISYDNMDLWRVLLKSKEDSWYQGSWFCLIVSFGESYPLTAPIVKFVTPPLHPNINDEGFICNEILTTKYNRTISIIEILQEIQFMLSSPNFSSPIDTERMRLFAGHIGVDCPENETYRKKMEKEISGKLSECISMANEIAEEWIARGTDA